MNKAYLLRILAYPYLKSTRLLPKSARPYSASVKLTERCNSKCLTCNYWRTPSTDGISAAQAVELIRELAGLGIRTLQFTGGEPLLRPDFFSILEQIQGRPFPRIVLATNGLLLKTYAERINHSCLTHVTVSLDGVAETNDRIRGIPGHFQRALEGLSLLQGKTLSIATTLNQFLAPDLDQLLALCRRSGYAWGFNLPDNRIYFQQDTQVASVWPSPEATEQMMASIQKNYRYPGYQLAYAKNYLRHQGRDQEKPCLLGFFQIFIDSQGRVYPGCYFLPPVGNVRQAPLSEIVNSDLYYRTTLQMAARQCAGCSCGYFARVSLQHPLAYALHQLMNRERGALE